MSGHSWSWGNWAWTDTRSNPSSGSSSYDNRSEAWASYDLTVDQGGWYSQGVYNAAHTDLGSQPWMGPAFVIGSANHDYHSVRSSAVPQQWHGPHGPFAPSGNHEGWQQTGLLTSEFADVGSVPGGAGTGSEPVTGPDSAERPDLADLPETPETESVEVGGNEPDADVRLEALPDAPAQAAEDTMPAPDEEPELSLEDKEKLWDLQARLTNLFGKMRDLRRKIDGLGSGEERDNATALLAYYEKLESDIRQQMEDLNGSGGSGFNYDAEEESTNFVAAVGGGLVDGVRAVGNAAVDTVVSFVTVGQMDGLEVFGRGGEGSTAAYGFARGGTEVLFGMATAGFSCVSKLGKGIFILDMLGNARAAGTGAADIHENGASVGNVIQTIGGALGLLGNASRLTRNGGCFVPGTLVQVSAVPSPTSSRTSVLCGETDALLTWPSFCEASENSLIPIEHVSLGSRVPVQNPRLEDYDFSLPAVEQATWRRIGLQVRRDDGALVEMDLLRPSWWVERSNMSVGRAIDLRVSELQLDGTAIVTSLAACCPVADGSGSVVTGRFVTREVSNLVEMVLENGTTLTGTSTHPVWTVNHHDWTPLAELVPGDLVDTDTGPQPIASIRTLNHVSDVFNIEVHGHHVYRVTKDAILVHNACPDVPDSPNTGPVHHLGTNKNFVSTARGGPWSPKFKAIFDKAGIDLDDAINKIAVPGHKGPHPEAYHQLVYDRLLAATKGLKGDAYKTALEAELAALKLEATTVGSIVNKLLTKTP